MRHLDAVPFLGYFIKLRLRVALGMHYTAAPLGLTWRWHHYRAIKDYERRCQ
jgi:hypothetical protein